MDSNIYQVFGRFWGIFKETSHHTCGVGYVSVAHMGQPWVAAKVPGPCVVRLLLNHSGAEMGVFYQS